MGVENKTVKNALVGRESILGPARQGIADASSLPDVTPDEKKKLDDAVDIVDRLRLRQEFPILGRVRDMLVARRDEGKPLEPLSRAEVSGLLALMGPLSNAENQFLITCADDLKIITKKDWDDLVVPHRAATEKLASKAVTTTKYVAATVGNMSVPALLGFAVVAIAGGPLGAVGAMAVGLGTSQTVTKKIQRDIYSAQQKEALSVGMNAAEGQETRSELAMLAQRIGSGAAFDVGQGGSFADALRREDALANLVLEARQASGEGFTVTDIPFLDSVDKYCDGVAALAKTAGSTGEAALRKAAFSLRADALKGEVFGAVAPQLAASMAVAALPDKVAGDPQRIELIAVETLSRVLGQLEKEPDPAKRSTLAYNAVAIAAALAHETPPRIGADVEASIRAASSSTDPQAWAKPAASLGVVLKQAAQSFGVDDRVAEGVAKAAVNSLFSDVLPGLKQLDAKHAPNAVAWNVTETKNGWRVEGDLTSGFWQTPGGHFSVDVLPSGTVVPESFQVDVGERTARQIAEAAVASAQSMLASGVDVKKSQIVGTPKPGVYDVEVRTNDGNARTVTVGQNGLVSDWSAAA